MEQLVETPPPEEKATGLTAVILRVSQIMSAVGAIALFGMVVITVIDVGGRNIFLKPLNGSFELVGILLVIAGTWGMGYCQVLKMNIRIGIIADRFSERGQAILWAITLLISAVVAVLVTWQALVKTGSLITAKLGARTDTLGIPVWPFMLMT
jgi:TRAP-type transport system small permease protein